MTSGSNNKDSILAITLLLLLFFLYSHSLYLIYAAILFIVISLLFAPVAILFDMIWKKVTQLLGMISSTIILSVLFYVIIFPFGIILKLFKKNLLMLNMGSRRSTFIERNKLFSNSDMQNPY